MTVNVIPITTARRARIVRLGKAANHAVCSTCGRSVTVLNGHLAVHGNIHAGKCAGSDAVQHDRCAHCRAEILPKMRVAWDAAGKRLFCGVACWVAAEGLAQS